MAQNDNKSQSILSRGWTGLKSDVDTAETRAKTFWQTHVTAPLDGLENSARQEAHDLKAKVEGGVQDMKDKAKGVKDAAWLAMEEAKHPLAMMFAEAASYIEAAFETVKQDGIGSLTQMFNSNSKAHADLETAQKADFKPAFFKFAGLTPDGAT